MCRRHQGDDQGWGMRVFRKLTVPDHVHPLVKVLFEEMNRQQIGVCDIADRSGVNKNTIIGWRKRAVPNLVNIEACYTVMGYQLKLAKCREKEE